MTEQEIIDAAREAGVRVTSMEAWGIVAFNGGKFENLQRFAAIIEAKTLERAAVVCEETRKRVEIDSALHAADAIRALAKLGGE